MRSTERWPASKRKPHNPAMLWRVHNALRAACVRQANKPGFEMGVVDSEMVEYGVTTKAVHCYMPLLTEHQLRYQLQCLREKGYIYQYLRVRGVSSLWWARGSLDLIRRQP